MPVFGAKTMTMLIKEVAEDPSMNALDVTNNASVRMKPLDFLNQLAGPLKAHKGITRLVLRECELNDPCCEVISGILAENDTIEEVDLQKNKITSVGAIALSEGLRNNKGVRTLDLMGQATSSANFGEETLERFLKIYQTNITLTKIIWRLESRKASSLATAMTRNVEIAKRQANGKAFDDLLPDGMREGAPAAAAPVDPPEAPPASPPADDGAEAKKAAEEVAAKEAAEAEAKKVAEEAAAKEAADAEAKKVAEEAAAKEAAEPGAVEAGAAEAEAAPAKKEKKPLTELEKIHSAVRWGKTSAEIEAVVAENGCSMEWMLAEHDPKNGNLAMHIAAQNNHVDLTRYLLEQKADVDAKNTKGQTALHMTAEYDMYDLTKMLLEEFGASRDITNNDGHAAITGIDGGKVGGEAWDAPLNLIAAGKTKEDLDAALAKLEEWPDKAGSLDKAKLIQTGMGNKKRVGADWDHARFMAVMKSF